MESQNHALWCDPGEHAFSPRTIGYEEWTRRVSDPETGMVKTITMLVCPKHLTNGPVNIPAQIEE